MNTILKLAFIIGISSLLFACEKPSCYDCYQEMTLTQTDSLGQVLTTVDTSYNKLCEKNDVDRLLKNWNIIDSSQTDSVVQYVSTCTQQIVN